MGKRIHVVVLEGGFSSEREISLKTAAGVKEALAQKGFIVSVFDVRDGLLTGFDASGVDLAFIALHGEFGEDGGIQALLEEIGLPYTGSGVEASRLAMNKVEAKECFAAAGLRVPRHVAFDSIEELASCKHEIEVLQFPLVVKPITEGSSIGLSIVDTREALDRAIEVALLHQEGVIVEEYIEGRELTVGILGDLALPVIEIHPYGEHGPSRVFDFHAKYSGKSRYDTPALLPPDVAERVREVAITAHRSLGCRDVSRVDLRLEKETSVPVVLEVNTIPGMTGTSLLPKAAACVGISYADVCARLVWMALQRIARQSGAMTG